MLLARLLIAGAVLISFVLPSWAASRLDASTSPNLTGTWSIEMTGPPTATCSPSPVKQHGTALFMGLFCFPFGSFGVLAGTIDKTTGDFTVASTYPSCKGFGTATFTMTGTASQNGTMISGTWQTVCISPIKGTFSGQLTGEATITFVPPSLTPTPTDTPAPPTLTPTPTDTPAPPTSTDTPAPPVGGISRDPAFAPPPLPAEPASSGDAWLLAGAVGALAAAIVLSGGVWYGRARRWLR